MAGSVLLAIRVGPESEVPTRVAARLARLLEDTLVVVYVALELETATIVAAGAALDDESVRQAMRDKVITDVLTYVKGLVPDQPVEVVVTEGEVSEAIARVAAERNADFLVVGTKGRGALSRLVLGDTTHDIVKRTPCPVVVVPRNVHI
jgi:nucleotide-binding universal stress UspA family protein